MELVFITHGSLGQLHYLSPLISWAIVLGGIYGLVRLIVDPIRYVRKKIAAEASASRQAIAQRPAGGASPSAQ